LFWFSFIFLSSIDSFHRFLFNSQGSNATGDCCSKCWNDSQKKKKSNVAPSSEDASAAAAVAAAASSVTHAQSQHLDTNTTNTNTSTSTTRNPNGDMSPSNPISLNHHPQATNNNTMAVDAQAPLLKKKKKKTSYKDMMASYTSKRKSDADIEKEKESSIQKVTGGGAFLKIDKI
jgi:hypothetical protein